MLKYDDSKGNMETVDAMGKCRNNQSFDGKSTYYNRMVYTCVLQDSMARVAPSSVHTTTSSSSSVFTFSSANPDKLFYSDGASADLIVFEYDVSKGTTNGQLRSILLNK